MQSWGRGISNWGQPRLHNRFQASLRHSKTPCSLHWQKDKNNSWWARCEETGVCMLCCRWCHFSSAWSDSSSNCWSSTSLLDTYPVKTQLHRELCSTNNINPETDIVVQAEDQKAKQPDARDSYLKQGWGRDPFSMWLETNCLPGIKGLTVSPLEWFTLM